MVVGGRTEVAAAVGGHIEAASPSAVARKAAAPGPSRPTEEDETDKLKIYRSTRMEPIGAC